MMAEVKEIVLDVHGDTRGKLIALEGLSDDVSFGINRIYYIYDTTPGTIRGKHAHRELKQLLVCVSGACTIDCEFPNGDKREYRLDWPNRGLAINGLIWRNMKCFSKDAVLLVLASEHYDESDYIRAYSDYVAICKKEGFRK